MATVGRSIVVVMDIAAFDSEEGYQSFSTDPERQAHRRLLDGVEIEERVLRVEEVQVG